MHYRGAWTRGRLLGCRVFCALADKGFRMMFWLNTSIGIQIKRQQTLLHDETSRATKKKRFAQRFAREVLFCSLVAPATILGEARSAWAQAIWVEQNGDYNGGPGCATAITVSANNLPVVLGCGLGTNTVFYQRGYASCPNGQFCNLVPLWNRLGGLTTVSHIVNDLNGDIWATDTSGNLVFAVGTGEGGYSGAFTELATTYYGGTACITSLAAPVAQTTPEVVPPETSGASSLLFGTFWGVGCGGDPNATLWMLPIDLLMPYAYYYGSTEWQQVGAAEYNAAYEIALFTDLNGTTITQSPWVVANGNVYFYNGQYFQQQVGAPADVTYVTDHYIVAGGNVYWWNGTANGGGTTTWTEVIGPTPNAPIRQIAWSQAVPGTSVGTVGPSQLWAIDTEGNIYYQTYASPLQ